MSALPNLTPDLKGKIAIISGATRGIGRVCAFALAKRGCNIVVAAKTVEPQPTLPNTIFSVAKEIRDQGGGDALPFQINLRDASRAEECVKAAVEQWPNHTGIILINNASALWWQEMVDTPISKYNLITEINCRGAFALTKACMPHMLSAKWGRVINMSPPIRTDYQAYKGMTAYNISKMGMTMVAMGAAAEGKGHGISGNSLWPATVIESSAAENFQLGDKWMWRKADILSDCVLALCAADPKTATGMQLIDEDYLASCGMTDFSQYQMVPGREPPKMSEMGDGGFNRGSVHDAKPQGAASKM